MNPTYVADDMIVGVSKYNMLFISSVFLEDYIFAISHNLQH